MSRFYAYVDAARAIAQLAARPSSSPELAPSSPPAGPHLVSADARAQLTTTARDLLARAIDDWRIDPAAMPLRVAVGLVEPIGALLDMVDREVEAERREHSRGARAAGMLWN